MLQIFPNLKLQPYEHYVRELIHGKVVPLEQAHPTNKVQNSKFLDLIQHQFCFKAREHIKDRIDFSPSKDTSKSRLKNGPLS